MMNRGLQLRACWETYIHSTQLAAKNLTHRKLSIVSLRPWAPRLRKTSTGLELVWIGFLRVTPGAQAQRRHHLQAYEGLVQSRQQSPR